MTDVKGRFKKSISRSEISSSSSSSTSSFSSEDESDSDEDLKPIKEYLSNRREAARQLFKSVKIEKIRMMLPQVLKKMELNELEEWCANELAGMSKTRILSILNGSPMSGSSDTSDSNDSGPSLEIISDTEEWLTDEEINIKKEPLSPTSKTKKLKTKRKITKSNKNDLEKVKGRKGKSRTNQDTDTIKIKKEKDKNDNKNQEGESLLDLLELEMRARAIRALIRKEEDIIPTSVNEKNKNPNNIGLKINNDSINNKNKLNYGETSLSQIETSETLIEKIGEDEDVVLLVKPTPTIELISSDSETENSIERINKKLDNERLSNKINDINKSSNDDKIIIEKNEENFDSVKINLTTDESSKLINNGNTNEDLINKVDNVNIPVTQNETSESGKQTFRKLKRRPQLRNKSKSLSESKETTNLISQVVNNELEQSEKIQDEKIEIKNSKEFEKNENKNIKKITTSNEDKLGDYEEIIDLDDYPDDMYVMETDENINDKNKSEEIIKKSINNKINLPDEIENSEETWATRYYQTDSVQNVIKESKIQSEIRKRLRERQRLSKLNNSPKKSPKSNDEINEIKSKPLGSVDEYLALKNSNNDSNLSEKIQTKNNKNQINEEMLPVCKEETDVPISVTSTSLENILQDDTNKSIDVSDINKL